MNCSVVMTEQFFFYVFLRIFIAEGCIQRIPRALHQRFVIHSQHPQLAVFVKQIGTGKDHVVGVDGYLKAPFDHVSDRMGGIVAVHLAVG